MPERLVGSKETIKKEDGLTILRRILPELFIGNPNSIRTGFNEAKELIVVEYDKSNDPRKLQAETVYDGQGNLFLRHEDPLDYHGWGVTAVITSPNHQISCLWFESIPNYMSEAVEIRIRNLGEDPFSVSVDYEKRALRLGNGKQSIPLSHGFNEERFNEFSRKSREAKWLRIHNAVILDTNLFYMSYSTPKMNEKARLIVPIQISRPSK